LTAGGRALLIAPRANRGLRPADLEEIESFAGRPHQLGHSPIGQHRATPPAL
jgi:hypothetical protein